MADYSAWLQTGLDEAATRLLNQPLTGELYRPLEVVRYQPAPDDVSHEGRGRPAADGGDRRGWEQDSGKPEREKPRPAAEVLRQSCVILGDPGAGKSELLRHAVREELQRVLKRADAGEPTPPPIYLRVADLVTADKGLKEFVRDELRTTQVDTDPRKRVRLLVLHAAWRRWTDADPLHRNWVLHAWWQGWTEGRPPLLALDGLDEAGDQKKLLPHLQLLLSETRTVLTSRIVGYDGTQLRAPREREWRLQPLGLDQAQAFVKAYLPDRTVAETMAEELARKPAVAQLASNPLALALLCRVYGRDTPLNLPLKRGELYERVIEDLLGGTEARRRDASAAEWEQSRPSKRAFLEELAWSRYPQVAWTVEELDERERKFLRSAKRATLRRQLRQTKQSLYECLQSDHGLLVPYGAASRAFLHKALLDYLAASHLARRIDKGGFDAKLGVWEKGRPITVTVRHYLDRKAWSPAHTEMLALLGARVNDAPALITLIKDGAQDDSLRRRFCLAVRIASEVPTEAAHCCPVTEALTEQLMDLTIHRLPSVVLCENLLTELAPQLEQGVAEKIAERLLSQLSSATDERLRSERAKVISIVTSGVGERKAHAFAKRLLERISSTPNASFRQDLARPLGSLAARLDDGAAASLVGRLDTCLQAEADSHVRSNLLTAVAALAPRLVPAVGYSLTEQFLTRAQTCSDDDHHFWVDAYSAVARNLPEHEFELVAVRLVDLLAAAQGSRDRNRGLFLCLYHIAPRLDQGLAERLSDRLLRELGSVPDWSFAFASSLTSAFGLLASRLSKDTAVAFARLSFGSAVCAESEFRRSYFFSVLEPLAPLLAEGDATILALKLLDEIEQILPERLEFEAIDALKSLLLRLDKDAAELVSNRLMRSATHDFTWFAQLFSFVVVRAAAPFVSEDTVETLARRLLEMVEPNLSFEIDIAIPLFAPMAPRMSLHTAQSLVDLLLRLLQTAEAHDTRRLLARALADVSEHLPKALPHTLTLSLLRLVESESNVEIRRHMANALKALASFWTKAKSDEFALRLITLLVSEKDGLSRAYLAEAFTAVAPWLTKRTSESLAGQLIKIIDSMNVSSDCGDYRKMFDSVAPHITEELAKTIADHSLSSLEYETNTWKRVRLAHRLRAVAQRLTAGTTASFAGRLLGQAVSENDTGIQNSLISALRNAPTRMNKSTKLKLLRQNSCLEAPHWLLSDSDIYFPPRKLHTLEALEALTTQSIRG